jgi:hypothetical protein
MASCGSVGEAVGRVLEELVDLSSFTTLDSLVVSTHLIEQRVETREFAGE